MIRKAVCEEHAQLTTISFSAKKYWNYPAAFYAVWKDELTITPAYIANHEVFLHESHREITGFYSLVELHSPYFTGKITLGAGLWLEHMFILPQHIGNGIGRKLFHHCITGETFRTHKRLRLLADPHAVGFYRKMGCSYLQDFPSTIPGRTTPCFVYTNSE